MSGWKLYVLVVYDEFKVYFSLKVHLHTNHSSPRHPHSLEYVKCSKLLCLSDLFISLILSADSALPTSSKNKTDYQATIIGFQRIYLWKGRNAICPHHICEVKTTCTLEKMEQPTLALCCFTGA